MKPVVLSIDDDPDYRKILEVVLKKFGLNVTAVATPEDFLSKAKELKPDLYLIDLHLAESSGIDLIQRLRKGVDPNALILVISSTQKGDTIQRALAQGANDYILKNLDKTLLATKLSQFLDTDEIRRYQTERQSISIHNSKAVIEFSGSMTEIDELGVGFSSATLVPKGTVMRLSSEFFKQLGRKEKDFLVTVVTTQLIPETQQYQTYAEFDGADPEFLQSLRKWLRVAST